MHWELWLGISIAVFLFMLISSVVSTRPAYRKNRIFTVNKLLPVGTFLSALILLFPIYLGRYFGDVGVVEYLKSTLMSAIHALRLFAFDGGYADVFESGIITSLPEKTQLVYGLFGAFLYFFAPALTLKFVLSLFKNTLSHVKYAASAKPVTHVFSELNKKSYALAKSIDDTYNKKDGKYKLFRKNLIVFNSVADRNDALVEEAMALGAICFSGEMNATRYKLPRQFGRLSFYLISEDEKKKIDHAEFVLRDYDFENVEMYLFVNDIRCDLYLSTEDAKRLRLIRINETQSLIYHNLDVNGMRLFENARAVDGDEKLISAVIIGLDDCGTEMLKALSWFSQMDGYSLKIRAFDRRSDACDRLKAVCPDLLNDEINGKKIPGESRYDIEVLGGVDIKSASFFKHLSNVQDPTYIFISLGSDMENLEAAVAVRSMCERLGYSGDNRRVDIETVISDSQIAKLLGEKWNGDKCAENKCGVANFKKQPYRIHIIGDTENLYSVDTMLNSELVERAFRANEIYAERVYEDELEKISLLPAKSFDREKARIMEERRKNIRAFYKYGYNYRSSIARIIHEKKSIELGTKSAEQEHRRWNAYMRSEGYQYSGSDDSSTRNDLAKLHHNLVPFSELKERVDIAKDN